MIVESRYVEIDRTYKNLNDIWGLKMSAVKLQHHINSTYASGANNWTVYFIMF